MEKNYFEDSSFGDRAKNKNLKILEIAVNSDTPWRRTYVVFNPEVSDGQGNSKFFEGVYKGDLFNDSKKRITALSQAKNWAKEKGYTHVKVLALKRYQKEKLYTL